MSEQKVKDSRLNNDNINNNNCNVIDDEYLLSPYSVPSIIAIAFIQIVKSPKELWGIGFE